MQLDIKDRFMIANQLKILEKLYPEEASYYSEHRTAVEKGFSLHYSSLVEHFYEEMTEEECREVLEILNMYRLITFSYDRIENPKGIDIRWLKFKGFDENNEVKQFSYVQYIICELGRFDEFRDGDNYQSFNSQTPTLEQYRRMLDYWNSLDDKVNLTTDQLIELLEVEV